MASILSIGALQVCGATREEGQTIRTTVAVISMPGVVSKGRVFLRFVFIGLFIVTSHAENAKISSRGDGIALETRDGYLLFVLINHVDITCPTFGFDLVCDVCGGSS